MFADHFKLIDQTRLSLTTPQFVLSHIKEKAIELDVLFSIPLGRELKTTETTLHCPGVRLHRVTVMIPLD